MLLPCTPCCKQCGSELDPTTCPASVSAYDCPTFWVEFDSKPYPQTITVDRDLNGANAQLLCGAVTVKDSNGVTLMHPTGFTTLPRAFSVPANEDKVQVIVADFGGKPTPLGRCGPWNPGTPAPLIKVSCPYPICGVAFEHDRLEVTVAAAACTAVYEGTGVNDFDPSCPNNGRIERRFDGLNDFDDVYELTLVSDAPISSSTHERKWRYDFPAFDCYAAGENYIEVKATYNKVTSICGINYELRFHHMEQREKHSGTPSAWAYACAGRGCPPATACLWYDDVLNVASRSIAALEPQWTNADIPAAIKNIAPAQVTMNKYPFCSSIGTSATLNATQLTGNAEVSISLEFFT